jgi:hypothetical protein
MGSSHAALVLVVASLAVTHAACDKKKSDPEGAPPAAAGAAASPAAASASPHVETVEIPELAIRGEGKTTVRVTWSAPDATEVNEEAPFRVRWNRSDGLLDAPSDVKATGSVAKDGFQVKVEPTPGTPNATLGGTIDLVVCDAETHSVCVPVRRSLELGFVVQKDGPTEADVSIPLPQAKPR